MLEKLRKKKNMKYYMKKLFNLNLENILLLILIILVVSFMIYKLYNNNSSLNELFTNITQDVENFESDNYYNPDNEVLIVFCKMKGCGHCDNFNDNVWTKSYKELNNSKTNNNKTLRLLVVEPTHPLSEDVEGFPTIKKYGADPNKYEEFNESRTIDNFKKFCMS